ncbi:MAG: C4-type zinc ribbon domain-containing protein [Chloroflexi bacterium]|nr:C4-type zinc ribbon domain-containing protein [Chloroflexota bacterium]
MGLVTNLWHLNLIDQEFDEKARRTRQVDAALVDAPALDSARRARETAAGKLREARGALSSRELEARGLDAKIKEVENRLYGGHIGNPKELDGLEKDLEMHKRRRSELDDTLLALMDDVDRFVKETNEKAAAAEQAESERSGEVAKLERERASLSERMAELQAEQTRLRGELGVEVQRQYDQLRRTKGGRAVAHLRGDSCGTCGVTVPTGHVHRVHAGDEIVVCSSCGRILAT